MWRLLETELRKLLTGHESGNAGYWQGAFLRIAAPAVDPTRSWAPPFHGLCFALINGLCGRWILVNGSSKLQLDLRPCPQLLDRRRFWKCVPASSDIVFGFIRRRICRQTTVV